MARPTEEVFTWATDEFDSQGSLNKARPAPEFSQTGFVAGQGVPRLWLNYSWGNHGEWLDFLINDSVGTVKTTSSTVSGSPQTIIEASELWGGTWSLDDTTLTGYNLFTKTSLT